MFGNGPSNEALHTGKKVTGLSSRRQSEFSLGWGTPTTTNQLNHIQMKKSKNFQVTGKVTQHVVPERQTVLKPVPYSKVENQPIYSSQDSKWIEYQRLMREYPDIPAQQLERIVMGYEQAKVTQQQPAQQRGGYQDDYNRKGVSSKGSHAPSNIINNSNNERRTPMKPKQSMKDIIYGGQIGTENQNPRRANSRRNNTNLILGDGFNHFKNQY